MNTQDRPLRHDPKLGEVDPRTYPLLCLVKLECKKVGSHERILQVSRLQRVIDTLSTGLGEPKVRAHFTVDPEVDSKTSVEVRLQPLTIGPKDAAAFVSKVREAIKALPKVHDYELIYP